MEWIFFFSLSWRFPTYFGLKISYDGVFKSFEFFCYFLGIFYFGSGWDQSKLFFFSLSFSAFPNFFWIEMKLWWCFLIFWIFSLFFWNFLLQVGSEPNGMIFFIFSLSQPLPTYPGLKISFGGVFQFFKDRKSVV